MYIIIAICIIGVLIIFCPPFLHESYTDQNTEYSGIVQGNANYSLAGQLKDIPKTGIIPPGWYSIAVMNTLISGSPIVDMMAHIPDGCSLRDPLDPKSGIASSDGSTSCQNSFTLTKGNSQPSGPSQSPTSDGPAYNPYDINEVYHHNELNGQDKEKSHTVFNPILELVDPPPIYYETGTYKVDPVSYVPNYADSLYLSKTTGLSQTSPITDAPYLYSGFCKQDSSNKQLIDDKCRKLDKDVCASTECCVLLGGQKCVAGNDQGPSINNSYSDFTITNRDFYYYTGKCYGNCPNGYFGPMNIPGMTEGNPYAGVYGKQFSNGSTNTNIPQSSSSPIYTISPMNPVNPLNPMDPLYPIPTWPQQTPDPNYPCMPTGGDPSNNGDLNCTFKAGNDPITNELINVCSNDSGYTCQSISCCNGSPTAVPITTPVSTIYTTTPVSTTPVNTTPVNTTNS